MKISVIRTNRILLKKKSITPNIFNSVLWNVGELWDTMSRRRRRELLTLVSLNPNSFYDCAWSELSNIAQAKIAMRVLKKKH